MLLFVFLASVAAGTFLGGPLVDRFGAKFVIWGSILGVLPFTLLLPHLGLVGTVINSIAIGLVLSSAFSAMIVYAQELTPGNVGAVAGLFFGLSFGLGGLGAALLGMLADKTSLTFVYQVCAFLPAVGLLGRFPAFGAGQGGRDEEGLSAFDPLGSARRRPFRGAERLPSRMKILPADSKRFPSGAGKVGRAAICKS